MPLMEKIALAEIDDKKTNASEKFSNKSAIITHYLQNSKNKISNFYEKEAIKITQEILEKKYPEKIITKKKAEDALRNGLFENLEVPFPSPKNPEFTFIDLFAGIGGFRLALQNLGGKCIYTSEWDQNAKNTYFANFGEIPFGDITNEKTKAFIPTNFDVLCAGFPCQPFSKGGHRNGFEDTRGTLFFDICEIIQKHQPKILLLENVTNLVSHDGGNTYKVILKNLDQLGYIFPEEALILSPDNFGVPTLRPRVYIPCVRKDIAEINVDFIKNIKRNIKFYFSDEVDSIDSIINFEDKDSQISAYELNVLKVWNEFYKNIDLDIIGFPIWTEYFKYDGDYSEFPEWKAKFILKNVSLYQRNQKFIDEWLAKNSNLDGFIKTHRKMEWQAGKSHDDIFDCLIQFRPSGVRVKKADKFSTLVAMNHQQIIGKLRRKISIDESKLLQSFPKNYILNPLPSVALKQLGNSVNVKVVEIIFKLMKEKYLSEN